MRIARAAAFGGVRKMDSSRRSLGGALGFSVAALGVLNHTLEVAVQLPPSVGAILGPGRWVLMFLVFALACSMTFMKSESVRLGLLSSAWCGLVYAGVLVAFALALGFGFRPHMERILGGLYAASGMTDPAAFVTPHLVTNASSHLFSAPLIALAVGAVSASACLLLRSIQRRTALVLRDCCWMPAVARCFSLRRLMPGAFKPFSA